MKRLKKVTAIFMIALIGIAAIPQISKADKPAYCREAMEECVELMNENIFWDVGVAIGCGIGYANCG